MSEKNYYDIVVYPELERIEVTNSFYATDYVYNTVWGYRIYFGGWHRGQLSRHEIKADSTYPTEQDATAKAKTHAKFLSQHHDQTKRFEYWPELEEQDEE